MAKKDYYEILNVKKNDSDETIKKSYKKLAIKYHPDKASENKKQEYENKFKEINEAYTVLSNPEKRRQYDMGNMSGFSQSSGFKSAHMGDFSSIFEELLRGSGMGGFSNRSREEDLDLHYELIIDFEEAAFGTKKEILVKRNSRCNKCEGTGSKDKKFETCQKCNGTGAIRKNHQTPWGIITRTVECNECDGTGKTIKNKCKNCNGKGTETKKEKIKIKIPAGINNGQTIRIPKEGNSGKNNSKGDLFLTIQVRPHEIFKRDNFDIYMKFPITFSKAALGGQIKIPTLKKEVKVKLKKGTQSGAILRLKGHGIPFVDNPNYVGDQFVEIIVKTPKKLSRAQTKLFKKLSELD